MKIGLLGFGVVGSGAYSLLEKHFKDSCLVQVLVRDVEKYKQNYPEIEFTNQAELILDNSEIDLIIETIGGLEPAYTYVKKALSAGKHVITSNKALVYEYHQKLSKLAAKNQVQFRFEASVGGGIPIINALENIYWDRDIQKISGILNGTSNYILSAMFYEKLSYQQALNQAQKLGYAEENPIDDVEGMDTFRKIGILSQAYYGGKIRTCPGRRGIKELSLADIEFAKLKGYHIKLIASIEKVQSEKFEILLVPRWVPEHESLAHIEYAENRVDLKSKEWGTLSFIGQGAGHLATGLSVVSDLQKIAEGKTYPWEIKDKTLEQVTMKHDYCVRPRGDKNIKKSDIESISRQYRKEVFKGQSYYLLEQADILDVIEIFGEQAAILKIESEMEGQ